MILSIKFFPHAGLAKLAKFFKNNSAVNNSASILFYFFSCSSPTAADILHILYLNSPSPMAKDLPMAGRSSSLWLSIGSSNAFFRLKEWVCF